MNTRLTHSRVLITIAAASLVAQTLLLEPPHGSAAENPFALSKDSRRVLEEFGLRDLAVTPEPPRARVDEATSRTLRAHVLGLEAAYNIRRKRFAAARKALDEAAEIQPDNYWIQLSLADISRQTMNDEQALKICDKLIREFPEKIQAYEIKGQVLVSNGRMAEAIQVYSKALERWPNCDSLVMKQLDLARQSGNLDLTIRICKRRLEREPRHFLTLWMAAFYSALKAQEAGDDSLLRESAEYYETALEVRPKATKLYNSLADVYERLSEPKRAFATMRRGVLADPTDLEIRKRFEGLASPSGDSTEILEAYRRLAEEYKSAVDIRELYAGQLLARAKYREACREYEKLLELRPKNVKTLLALGALELQIGETDAARTHFERAVAISGSAETYERVGGAFLGAKRYEEAAAFFEKALRENPRQMAVYFGLARAYQEMGQPDKSIEIVRRGLDAIRNAKGRKSLLVELSRAQRQHKQYDDAVANLRKAYELDRTDMLVFFRLADLLLEIEDEEAFEKLVAGGKKTFRSAMEQFEQQLSILLIEHHRYAKSIPVLESLKSRHSDQWIYYVQLATAYQRLRQTANGERLYEEAKDRLGDTGNFFLFAARYYGMRYETQKAADAVLKALDRLSVPKSAEEARERFGLYGSLIFNLSRSESRSEIERTLERAERELGGIDAREMKLLRIDGMTELKRYDRAVRMTREMIEQEPENPELYYKLGSILNEAKKIKEAEKALRKALELLPDPPKSSGQRDLRATVLNHLGYMFAEEGINLEESADLLTRALELEPRAGFIVDSMGWLQYKLGQIDKALVLLQKALDYSSEDPVLYDHLGDAWRKKGDSTKALECYEQALRLDPNKKDIQAKIKNLSRN